MPLDELLPQSYGLVVIGSNQAAAGIVMILGGQHNVILVGQTNAISNISKNPNSINVYFDTGSGLYRITNGMGAAAIVSATIVAIPY
jgi:hypothetical protein